MQPVRYFKKDLGISNRYVLHSRQGRRPTMESFNNEDSDKNKEFSIDNYKKFIARYIIEKKIKNHSDIPGMTIDELGRELGVDNGSIGAYVSRNRDKLIRGGDKNIYLNKRFYIEIKREIEQTLLKSAPKRSDEK